ncbi:heterokaryon incompatibility protein-domain-containing protein [Podospora aff. communis PSN243]|uniref:Heterokaryon incompatibility protein-domain-containing protein n=1 Tax=Podospora aff. communis PSN243 TaxID=3040156 RepID=A0AAV9H4D3_9PEZI|nr:heterokaryon incompatibility protein-domain-containing protein [Podospora aff. communis PSN243]
MWRQIFNEKDPQHAPNPYLPDVPRWDADLEPNRESPLRRWLDLMREPVLPEDLPESPPVSVEWSVNPGPTSPSRSVRPSIDLCFICDAEKESKFRAQDLHPAKRHLGIVPLQAFFSTSSQCGSCQTVANYIKAFRSELADPAVWQQGWEVSNFAKGFGCTLRSPSEPPLVLEFAPESWRLPGTTSSNKTASTIRKWISECEENHPLCSHVEHGTTERKYTPTRILDLRENPVTLREGEWEGRYACLSHRWGDGVDMLKTTKDSLATFKSGIQWESLPKNFQHAVEICRSLGINFLWIDALCIVQDDDWDWHSELPRMAEVYADAFLTIAATAATSPAAGCFSTAHPDYIGYTVPHTVDGVIRRMAPRLPVARVVTAGDDNSGDRSQWPLLQRAWVYQEMRLSCRVLHYGAQEVTWVCRTMEQSEGTRRATSSRSPSRLPSEAMSGWLPLVGRPQNLCTWWHQTVREYSRLQLTFPKDRLPALSALSQRMEGWRVNDAYLAGLWRSTLPSDLVWRCEKPGRRVLLTSSSVEIVPSWSWISVDCQVTWGDGKLYKMPSVRTLEPTCRTRGNPHIGRLTEAMIMVRSPVFKAVVSTNRQGRRGLQWDDQVPFSSDRFASDARVSFDIDVEKGTETWMVPVAFGIDPLPQFEGIVVRLSSHGGEHERVGHFRCGIELSARPSERPLQLSDFRKALNAMFSVLPSMDMKIV